MTRYVILVTSNDGYEAVICESAAAVPDKVRELLLEPDSEGDTLDAEEVARMERDLVVWDGSWMRVSGRDAWKVAAYVALLTEKP